MKLTAREKQNGRLALGLICAPAALCMVGAALIYNYQDAITPIIDSHDFCDSEAVLGVSEWIFPKIVSHCEAIKFTYLKDHPSADIAIIIDIYIALCFFVILVLSICCLLMVPLESSNLSLMKVRASPLAFWGYLAMALAFSCATIIFLFVDLELVDRGGSRSMAMFMSSWGLGPILQVFVLVFGGSMFILVTIFLIRLRFLLKGDFYATGDSPSRNQKDSD